MVLSLVSFGACDSGGSGTQDGATGAVDAVGGDDATGDDVATTTTPGDDATGTTTAPEDATTTAPPEDATTTSPEDATTTTPEDTATPVDTTPLEPPPIVGTSSTFIGDWQMDPGREVTKCVVRRLDNEDDLWVSQIRTELAKGSHHMIIYVSDETEERTTPFNCDPFVSTLKGTTYPLMITQIREETLTFPPGVAFKFAPHQMIRIEAHYLNYFPESITAHGDIHFDAIAADRVTDEANLLFYGNPDFEIPAGQTLTTPWRFLDVPAGSKVFALTGHEHAYGKNVEVSYATDAEDEGTSVYPDEGVKFDWEEPPVSTYDPPLTFSEGQGFRYRCTWENTSNHTVRFGESANAEMCFFWAYYYPSQGYRLCVSPGNIGNGVAGDQVCCPGHWVCDYLNQFL